MRHRLSVSLVALVASLALSASAEAQGRDVYLLPEIAESPMMSMGRAQPGVAASSPVGYGPNKGDVFAGLGFQNSTASGGDSDGSLSIGAGFMNSQELLGIEAVLTSLSTVRSGFGSRMVGSLKAHKAINNWGLGLGVEGIYLNGNEFDTDPSIYFAATTVRPVREAETFNQATLNFGLGTGRFQSAESFADGKSGVGVFASAAIRVNYFSSAILDYTGAQLNAAMSFSPFATMPIVITPSINDLTGAAGNAGRLALGAGISWKF
ncbi:MAG: hypothetical protein KF709_01105 [Gemmatimonadaceae bacterium]|nr:hypothetical protein [Gemmatimonadaceae bacterium]